MTFRPRLAIDLSSECFRPHPLGKPWLDFRSFVRNYWQLLIGYRLLVSDQAKIVLLEVAAEIKARTGTEVHFEIEDMGSPRGTRGKIADRKKEEIEQILLFLDPKSVLEQLKTVPLRMMSERGHRVRINFGAALWAEREWKLRTAVVRHQSEIHSGEAIVMVEENAIGPLFEFIKQHLDAIRLFPRIMTTASIKTVLDAVSHTKRAKRTTAAKETDEANEEPRVSVFKDSPHGELFGIGNQILQDYYNVPPLCMHPAQSSPCHVVAFTDYEGQPEIQMQKFYEICADPRSKVNLLLNKQTAEDWVRQFEAPEHSFSAGVFS
jgi:hypothetical protein